MIKWRFIHKTIFINLILLLAGSAIGESGGEILPSVQNSLLETQMNQNWRIASLIDSGKLHDCNILKIDFEKNGTAWIATSDGLCRYDGYAWQRYGKEQGLPSNFIRCVLVDSRNWVWAGTDNGAALLFDNKFTTLGSENHLAGPSVRRIREDNDGSIWFCSDKWPSATIPGGLTHLKDGIWTAYTTKNGLPDDFVLDYMQDSLGRQFFLTLNAVYQYQEGHWINPIRQANLADDDRIFWSITESPKYGLMVATTRSFFILKNNQWTSYNSAFNQKYNVTTTSSGDIMSIGHTGTSDFHFLQWSGEDFKEITNGFTKPEMIIEDILESPDSSLWCTGYNYLKRWNRTQTGWISFFNSIPAPQCIDKDNRLWFSNTQKTCRIHENLIIDVTPAQVVVKTDRQGNAWSWDKNTITNWSENPPRKYPMDITGINSITNFVEDATGCLWFYGKAHNQQPCLTFFDHNHWTSYNLKVWNKYNIMHAFPDPSDGIWAMLQEPTNGKNLLIHILSDSIIPVELVAGVPPFNNPNFFIDKKGTIFLFKHFGIVRQLPSESRWEQMPSLGGKNTQSCIESKDGIWFGYNGFTGGRAGWARYQNNHWKEYNYGFQPLAVKTPDESIYLGGDGFLYQISRNHEDAPSLLPLPEKGTITGLIKDSVGNLWVGVEDNLYRYTAKQDPPYTKVQAQSNRVRKDSSLIINFYGIQKFASGEPSQKNYHFSYSLDSQAWTPFMDSPSLAIAPYSLQPGNHLLQVKARDENWNIDPSQAVFNFSVTPIPLQEQLWFNPSMYVLLLSMIFLALSAFNAKKKLFIHAQNLEKMVEDRTCELRKSEEQLRQSQKMEAIGQLAGGIAHDFNNLLTAILGYSEIILKRIPSEDSNRKALDEIRKAGERAASLTKQLLAFSRKQIMEIKIVSLNDLITNIEPMLMRILGEDIKITTVLSPQLKHINADPSQIEQIILNLSVNARDAMPKGGQLIIETKNVEVDAEFHQKHLEIKMGKYVCLSISDTGKGISQEIQKHIFEPFFTTKEFGKGTGLGLSTVYGIVKQSESYIYIDSQPGFGAAFSIFFPEVADNKSHKHNRSYLQAKSLIGKETILLVEDNPAVREFISKILREYDYTIIEAESYKDIDKNLKADLLITDIILPGKRGQEIAQELSSNNPKIKVLYISGYPMNPQLAKTIHNYESHFLQKPFHPDVLLSKIRKLLDEITNH